MSEANTPFNRPEPSEFLDPLEEQTLPEHHGVSSKGDALAPSSSADLADPWQEEPSPESAFDLDSIFDASALDGVAFEDDPMDLPQPLMADAIQESLTTEAVPDFVPSESAAPEIAEREVSVAMAAWSDEINPATPPNLADLINLIQELNQCNGILMDRVSQLEDALESSQNALQAEVGRSQEPTLLHSPNDWVALQEQITNLFNQLEFAHQTNQRQQILIETLTEQLESSQERVAELEREAALIQQRYSEQTQLFAKSETACRDLQARLQRQQRYTLQFKAALEKCLEVPTPNYEGTADNLAASVTASVTTDLPKAQRIQPWSSHAQISATKAAWMKLQSLTLEAVPETSFSEAFSAASPAEDQSLPAAAAAQETALRTVSHLKLPSFGLPLLHISGPEAAEPLISESAAQVPATSEGQVPSLADPALRHHIDAAVKPLAEMLAEAILADSLGDNRADHWTEPLSAFGDQDEPASPLSELHSVSHAASWPSEFSDAADAETPDEAIDESMGADMTAEQLLASTMADAEDALWQDLARLIDVSPEEVVKASLTGDAAFESMPFEEAPAPPEPPVEREKPVAFPSGVAPFQVDRATRDTTSQPQQPAAAAQSSSDPGSTLSLIRKVAKAAQQAQMSGSELTISAQDSSGPLPALAHQASWPSPIVYPLRPTKKRQSLAMVDLPTFPRGQA